MFQLAIVIPAYKKMYFEEALSSLAKQTNKQFNVYIGDDNSPEDLTGVVSSFKSKLNIYYTKFPQNVGSKNLVNQWKRCVQLTSSEKWIWLFSDDDVADEKCVENFYKEVAANKDSYDVYRFNTCVIDESSKIIKHMPLSPKTELSEELAYNILLGKRGNCMPDHIFSRSVYEKNGGFVYTDFAQGADWATSILFAQARGLCIIDNALLYWRYSGSNISSTAHTLKDEITVGHIQFLEWILDHFKYLKEITTSITYGMMKDAVIKNFEGVIYYHYRGYNYSLYTRLFNFLQREARLSIFKTVFLLSKIKIRGLIPNRIQYIFSNLLKRSKIEM